MSLVDSMASGQKVLAERQRSPKEWSIDIWQLILYSWVGSQWAGVAHLGLAEKGFGKSEVDIKEIDLCRSSPSARVKDMFTQTNPVKAENLDPKYLKQNRNGTVPTLTASHLSEPLVDTRQILEFLDVSRPSVDGPDLTPAGTQEKAAANALIELVHSSDLDTSLILYGCLDNSEVDRVKASPLYAYLAARQTALKKYHSADPANAFHGAKLEENGTLYSIFTDASSADRDAFFKDTAARFKKFAAGLDELERHIRLPYATGDHVTLADLHIVPWLSHTLWALGTTDHSDFSKLEGRIQQTVPDFKTGPKLREWWDNFGKRDSFQEVFKELH